MKRILFLMMICFAVSGILRADDTVMQDTVVKPLTKKQKKAIEKRNREIKDSLEHEVAVAALKNRYYVLMADRLSIRGRMFLNPTPNTNFLLVQGDDAVIQLAANNGRLGLNGMGGITVEGKITGMRGGIPDKKGKISYEFTVTGPAVSAQVQLTLYEGCNQAVAIISPNFWSGNLTVYGNLVPYDKMDFEKAIKGTTFP